MDSPPRTANIPSTSTGTTSEATTTVASTTVVTTPRRNAGKGRGGKYFTPELLHLFGIMMRILPVGPLEWEKVTDEHVVRYPGRDTDSLRRKYTSTHRRVGPTGDPLCPAEVREAKRVKAAIGNKCELADCGSEFDMEAEVDSEGDDVGDKGDGSSQAGGSQQSASSNQRGLLVRRKKDKPDFMQVILLQMQSESAAREEARKERVEERKELAEEKSAAREEARLERLDDRRRLEEDRREAAKDRKSFNMMIASIASGYFQSNKKSKKSKKRVDGVNCSDSESE